MSATDPRQHLQIDLVRGDTSTSFLLPPGDFLVGSASHCDVRLVPDEASPEQLRVTFEQGSILVEALAATPPCVGPTGTVGPFSSQSLDDGAELKVGEIRLRFRRVDDKRLAGQQRSQRDGLHPLLQALGLVGVAAGLYFVLQEAEPPGLLDQQPPATALFADPGELPGSGCPTRDREGARYEAQRRLREARLKRERAPFYAKAGLEAVTFYAESSACAALAGDTEAAARTLAEARTLQEALGDEVHVRQVRLEMLLRRERYADAQHEVAVLRDFLQRNDTQYVRWLADVQQNLAARFARAEESN